jgi:surfeit locus 1 family protein
MSPRARAAIVLVVAFVGAAGTARLGVWQLDRAAQKTALHEAQLRQGALPTLDARALATDAAQVGGQTHRRVALEGRWLAEHTVYLDNRQMDGHPGFYVITPLQLAAGDMVLVQRGWLPRNRLDRTHLAPLQTPTQPVRIEGRIAPGAARLFEFDAAASGPIRQNLDIAAFGRDRGLPLRPLLVVQLDGEPADGLRREWAPPVPDVSKHHGYALQWFSLSALILGLYVWFQLIRPRRDARR